MKSRPQNTLVTLFSGRIATRRPDGVLYYDLKGKAIFEEVNPACHARRT